MMRLGEVGDELAARVAVQTGEASELQAALRHFELHGKILQPFQPRLDDQLAFLREGIFQPAELRRQHLRLEQPQRVAAGHAERCLHNNFVMAARANFGNGGECGFQRIYGHADFIFGAKLVLDFQFPISNRQFGSQNAAEKICAPGF